MSLIKQAQQILTEDIQRLTNLREFAESIDSTVSEICESVTHVLAGLEKTARSMSPKSIASFLAGVERISTVLPSAQVPDEKKQSTIRLLQAAAMTFDDLTKQTLPNQAIVKIAQFGAADAQLLQKYLNIVQQGPQSITNVANSLRYEIDRVMRVQQNQQPQQPSQVQRPQTSVQQAQRPQQAVQQSQSPRPISR